jgi:hypothetical protein
MRCLPSVIRWVGLLFMALGCLLTVGVLVNPTAAVADVPGVENGKVYPSAGTPQQFVILVSKGFSECELDPVTSVTTFIDGDRTAAPLPNFVRLGDDGALISGLIQNEYDRDLSAGTYSVEARCRTRSGQEALLAMGEVKVTRAFGVAHLSADIVAVAGEQVRAFFPVWSRSPSTGPPPCESGEYTLDGAPVDASSDSQGGGALTQITIPTTTSTGVHLVGARCAGEPSSAAGARALPIFVSNPRVPGLDVRAVAQAASTAPPRADPAPQPQQPDRQVRPTSIHTPLGWEVPRLRDMILDPLEWLRVLTVALAVVLLIGFPAELVNKTIEENRDEFSRWWVVQWMSRSRLWSGVAGLAVFSGLSALLTALFDSGATGSFDRLRGFAIVLLAIPVVALVYAYPMEAHARLFHRTVRGTLCTLPVGVVLAIVMTVVSLLTRWQPAYVYGLILAFLASTARRLSREQSGAGILTASLCVIAVCLLSLATADNVEPETWIAQFLGTVFVVGTQAVLFGLVPLTFMDGKALLGWSVRIWIAVYSVAAIMYVHVLVLSYRQVHSESEWPSLFETLFLFVAFGIASVLFWGYFRIRNRHLSGRSAPV